MQLAYTHIFGHTLSILFISFPDEGGDDFKGRFNGQLTVGLGSNFGVHFNKVHADQTTSLL